LTTLRSGFINKKGGFVQIATSFLISFKSLYLQTLKDKIKNNEK